MGFDLTGTNFNGDLSEVIYSDLAVGNEIVENDAAFLELNVPDKRELGFMTQTEDPFGAYVVTPTTEETVTTEYDKRDLLMEKVMIYELFTPEEWDAFWPELQSQGSQTDHMLNPDLIREMITLLAPNAGAHISKLFWEGNKAGGVAKLAFMDGLMTLAQADGNTVQVAAQGVITSVNILDILQDVIDAIPDKDYQDGNYQIAVSMADWRILQRKNTDAKKTTDGVLNDTFKNLLEEKKIVPFVGLAKDHIFCSKMSSLPNSNTVLGFWFDEKREMQDARIGRKANDSEEWFLRINAKLGANYRYSPNVIYYVPA